MLAEISAGLSSLKAAADLIKGLNAVQFTVATNDVRIELQQLVLEAQQSLFAAMQSEAEASKRIASLEQEIVSLKDWNADAQRYELADAGNGALAYRLKDGMQSGELAHWLCTTCYQDRKKSYLQPETTSVGRNKILRCNTCKTNLIVRGTRDA